MVVGERIVLDERNHEFCWGCLECSLRYDSKVFSNKDRAGNINLVLTGIKLAFKDLVLNAIVQKEEQRTEQQNPGSN